MRLAFTYFPLEYEDLADRQSMLIPIPTATFEPLEYHLTAVLYEGVYSDFFPFLFKKYIIL